MDCNKEEAIRAKSIAECRMKSMDFEGARKIALKAQSLSPDLEGISQILAVCEVHCASATTKMVGSTDWYAILQVEKTADESTIKKQYRKLALLLHPDKNKLSGAEGAFQQIGDAYKILSDLPKRSQYDMIRKGNFNGLSLNRAARQAYKPSAKKQPGPGVSNFAHSNGLKQDRPFPFSGNSKMEGNSATLTGIKPVDASAMGIQKKVEDDLINGNDVKFQKVQLQPIHEGEKAGKSPARQRKNSRNKLNRTAETRIHGSKSVRRSKRHKDNLTCDEIQDPCMDPQPPSKKQRQDSKPIDTAQTNNAFADVDREKSDNSHIHSEVIAPEFSNFEDERCASKFAVDQIWALYDDIDGMPRLYARVRKVFSRGFKIQLSWLEKDPRSIAEMKWCERGLPKACGSFKLGKSFCTQERQIFSHPVLWKKGIKRNSYTIYPRKGEIWALFSNWDVRWSSEPDNQRVYKYEVVEIVSDFGADGISVIHLAKIKEFMALFVRAAETEECLLQIPAKDVLRFSHRIPAWRAIGKEEDGVPEGALELDSASLPSDFKANIASIGIEVPKNRIQSDDCFRSIAKKIRISPLKTDDGFEPSDTKKMKMNGAEASKTSPASSVSFEYPESEFYDFEGDRLMEKLLRGQIWAFYCEIDKLPKYYGRIREVDRENGQVKVRWLATLDEEDDRCDEDKPPPACGVFKAIKETCTIDSVETFSHLVKAKPSVKGHYQILPEVGEVWAVFRYWNELRNSEFDIVEISARDCSGITASLLTKVGGYVSVFDRRNEGADSVKFIPHNKFLKFSHRIPAYQLTKELGSSSYWELDPAAVPAAFLTSKP